VLTLTAGVFTAIVTRRPAGLLWVGHGSSQAAPELSALALNDVVQAEIVLNGRALVVPVEAIGRDGSATPSWWPTRTASRRRPVRLGLTSVACRGHGRPRRRCTRHHQRARGVADGQPVVISVEPADT
jgi:hypothetical protein